MYPYLDTRVTRQPISSRSIQRKNTLLPYRNQTQPRNPTCHSICTYLSAGIYATTVHATPTPCRTRRLSMPM